MREAAHLMNFRLKVIPTLQAISLTLAVFLATLSIFMMLVDGVAVVFAYASLPFALLAFSQKNIKVLKVYGLLVFASLVVFAYMAFSYRGNESTITSEVPNYDLFEKCSNEMFRSKEDLSMQLTKEDEEIMTECLKNESG